MSETIRVLIVNDEPDVCNLWSMMVNRQADMEVIGTANDGDNAIKLATDLQPDVVMMDYMMPGMDGMQATAAITQQMPDMRIVIYTAHPDAHARAAEAGAVTGVRMPQPPRQMMQTLRDAVNGDA
jgi:DNA-binding NarL/FixJ family response regulator